MSGPNILYIHSHDTGRFIQPYGYAVPTPNLQRLAEAGMLFRQAFCAHPTCSPSRGALLTGMYPHNNGLIGLAHRGFSLNDYKQHILHTLRKAGYFCALSGTQHIDYMDGERYASRIGYDVILNRKERNNPGPNDATDCAVEFIKDSPQQPFFLSVGYGLTHREFPPHGPDDNPSYCRPPEYCPDTAATREDMAGFCTAVRELDARMGRVFDALAAAGLAENTLIICTTDHGIDYPRMKCNLTDGGTGVMLLIRGPGGLAGGKVVDAMVSQIDIFPTICELLGIDRPAWLQGKSMMPLIRGQALDIHDAVFTEIDFHAAYEPQRAVRTKRWKYIRRFDGRTRPVLSNVDDCVAKSLWLEHGWRDRPVAREQLYDLSFDPSETNNLAAESTCAEVLADMRTRLDAWMKQTDDPLLKGKLPMPEGAVLNRPDQLSPNDKPKNYTHRAP